DLGSAIVLPPLLFAVVFASGARVLHLAAIAFTGAGSRSHTRHAGQFPNGPIGSPHTPHSFTCRTWNSRTNVAKEFTGKIDVVFSDFMILWLTDDEAVAFSEGANQTGAIVQHATCNGIDGRDLAYWVALIPGDTFVDICAGYAVAS
ncbi:hypothetical protein LCGC14_2123520, partial [marine sediment metagenome]